MKKNDMKIKYQCAPFTPSDEYNYLNRHGWLSLMSQSFCIQKNMFVYYLCCIQLLKF